MTPAKLQELARQAGLTIDGDNVRSRHLDCVELAGFSRFAELVEAETLLSAAFHKLVRATALGEAEKACEGESLEDIPDNSEDRAYDRGVADCVNAVRALAQQAGGEPANRGTIPADRRHDAEQG